MEKSKQFFGSLSADDKRELAMRAGCSLPHLRNVFYSGHRPSKELAIALERVSKKGISKKELRPDILFW